jgi:hypothetical protein
MTLASLGAIAGVLAGLLSFDGIAHLVPMRGDKAELWRLALAGLGFGAVIGYGVLRWGRGTWWAAALATLGTTASFLAGMWLLQPAAQTYQSQKLPRSLADLFANPEFAMVLNSILAATFIFAVGIVASGAISSRAMRRIELFSMAVVVCLAVLAIYILVHSLQVALQLQQSDVTLWHRILVNVASAAWFALLGGGIGYGYMTYTPERAAAR